MILSKLQTEVCESCHCLKTGQGPHKKQDSCHKNIGNYECLKIEMPHKKKALYRALMGDFRATPTVGETDGSGNTGYLTHVYETVKRMIVSSIEGVVKSVRNYATGVIMDTIDWGRVATDSVNFLSSFVSCVVAHSYLGMISGITSVTTSIINLIRDFINPSYLSKITTELITSTVESVVSRIKTVETAGGGVKTLISGFLVVAQVCGVAAGMPDLMKNTMRSCQLHVATSRTLTEEFNELAWQLCGIDMTGEKEAERICESLIKEGTELIAESSKSSKKSVYDNMTKWIEAATATQKALPKSSMPVAFSTTITNMIAAQAAMRKRMTDLLKRPAPRGYYFRGNAGVGKTNFIIKNLIPRLAAAFKVENSYYSIEQTQNGHWNPYSSQRFGFLDEMGAFRADTPQNTTDCILRLLSGGSFTVSGANLNDKSQALELLAVFCAGNTPLYKVNSGFTAEAKEGMFSRLTEILVTDQMFVPENGRLNQPHRKPDYSHLSFSPQMSGPVSVEMQDNPRLVPSNITPATSPKTGHLEVGRVYSADQVVQAIADDIKLSVKEFTEAQAFDPVKTTDPKFDINIDQLFATPTSSMPDCQVCYQHGPPASGKSIFEKRVWDLNKKQGSLPNFRVNSLNQVPKVPSMCFLDDIINPRLAAGREAYLQWYNLLPKGSYVFITTNYAPESYWKNPLEPYLHYQVPGFRRRVGWDTHGALIITPKTRNSPSTVVAHSVRSLEALYDIKVRQVEAVVPPFEKDEADFWLVTDQKLDLQGVLSQAFCKPIVRELFTEFAGFVGGDSDYLTHALDIIKRKLCERPELKGYFQTESGRLLVYNTEITYAFSSVKNKIVKQEDGSWLLEREHYKNRNVTQNLFQEIKLNQKTSLHIDFEDALDDLHRRDNAAYISCVSDVIMDSDLKAEYLTKYVVSNWDKCIKAAKQYWWMAVPLAIFGALYASQKLWNHLVAAKEPENPSATGEVITTKGRAGRWTQDIQRRTPNNSHYNDEKRRKDYANYVGEDRFHDCSPGARQTFAAAHNEEQARRDWDRRVQMYGDKAHDAIENVYLEEKPPKNVNRFQQSEYQLTALTRPTTNGGAEFSKAKSKIKRNIVCLSFEGGYGHGLMLTPQYGVSVAHIFSDKQIFVESDEPKVHEPIELVKTLPDREVAFFKLPRPNNAFVDITDLLMPRAHYHQLTYARTEVIDAQREKIEVSGDYSVVAKSAYGPAYEGASWGSFVGKLAIMNMHRPYCSAGMSGHPFWTNYQYARGKERCVIAGLQSALGLNHNFLVLSNVHIEDWNDLVGHVAAVETRSERSREPWFEVTKIDQANDLLETPLMATEAVFDCFKSPENKTLVPHGPGLQHVADPVRVLPTDARTRIKPRLGKAKAPDIYEDIGEPAWDFEKTQREKPENIPLDKEGKRRAPYIRLSKADGNRSTTVEIRRKLFAIATAMASYYFFLFGQPEIQLLSLHEAISGLNDVEKTRLSTSAGPMIQLLFPGVTQKEHIMEYDAGEHEVKIKDTPAGNFFKHYATESWRMMRKRIRPFFLGAWKRKDEVLPKEKAWRSRIYNARDLVAVMAEKRVLAPLQALFIKHQEVASPQLSADWRSYGDKMMRRMMDNGIYSLVLDYSAFDFTVSPDLMAAAGWFVHSLYQQAGMNNGDLNAVLTLFETLQVQHNVLENQIFQTLGTIPSGMWGTSLLDSIVNEIVLAYAFIEAHPGHTYDDFKENCELLTGGDDAVISIDPFIMGIFDPKTMFQKVKEDLGMTLTSATKDDSSPLVLTRDIMFLSRTFKAIPNSPNHFYPLFKDFTMAKRLHWSRHTDKELTHIENMEIRQDMLAAPLKIQDQYEKYFYQTTPSLGFEYEVPNRERLWYEAVQKILSSMPPPPEVRPVIDVPMRLPDVLKMPNEHIWNNNTRTKIRTILKAECPDYEDPVLQKFVKSDAPTGYDPTSQLISMRQHGYSQKHECFPHTSLLWEWVGLRHYFQLPVPEKITEELRKTYKNRKGFEKAKWESAMKAGLVLNWPLFHQVHRGVKSIEEIEKILLEEPEGPAYAADLKPEQSQATPTVRTTSALTPETGRQTMLSLAQSLPQMNFLGSASGRYTTERQVTNNWSLSTTAQAKTFKYSVVLQKRDGSAHVSITVEDDVTMLHILSSGSVLAFTVDMDEEALETTISDTEHAITDLIHEVLFVLGLDDIDPVKAAAMTVLRTISSEIDQPLFQIHVPGEYMETAGDEPAPVAEGAAVAPIGHGATAGVSGTAVAQAAPPIAPYVMESQTTPVPMGMDVGWGITMDGLKMGGYGMDARDLAYKQQRVATLTYNSSMVAGTILGSYNIDPWDPAFTGPNIYNWAQMHTAFAGSFVLSLRTQAAPQIYGSLMATFVPFAVGDIQPESMTIQRAKQFDNITLNIQTGGVEALNVRPGTDRRYYIQRPKPGEEIPFYGRVYILANSQIGNVFDSAVQLPFLVDCQLHPDSLYVAPAYVTAPTAGLNPAPPITPFPSIINQPGTLVIDGRRPYLFNSWENTRDPDDVRTSCWTALTEENGLIFAGYTGQRVEEDAGGIQQRYIQKAIGYLDAAYVSPYSIAESEDSFLKPVEDENQAEWRTTLEMIVSDTNAIRSGDDNSITWPDPAQAQWQSDVYNSIGAEAIIKVAQYNQPLSFNGRELCAQGIMAAESGPQGPFGTGVPSTMKLYNDYQEERQTQKIQVNSIPEAIKSHGGRLINPSGYSLLAVVDENWFIPSTTVAAEADFGSTMIPTQRFANYWWGAKQSLVRPSDSAIVSLSTQSGSYIIDILVNWDGVWVDSSSIETSYAILTGVSIIEWRETISFPGVKWPRIRPLSPDFSWVPRQATGAKVNRTKGGKLSLTLSGSRRDHKGKLVAKNGKPIRDRYETMETVGALTTALAGGSSILNSGMGILGQQMGISSTLAANKQLMTHQANLTKDLRNHALGVKDHLVSRARTN